MLVFVTSLAMANEESQFYFGKKNNHRNLEIGFEYAELEQNNFKDIGPENYSFFIGQKFHQGTLKNWGWQLLSLEADLNPEHLQDESRVCCIKGNRENLTGHINHQRMYMNYYPSAVHVLYIKKLKKHLFSFELIPGFAIGYSNWYHKETLANEAHDLKAVTIGGGLRLRTTILEHFFIEYPMLDFNILAAKNTSTKATIGEAEMDRPEYFTLTALILTGFRVYF